MGGHRPGRRVGIRSRTLVVLLFLFWGGAQSVRAGGFDHALAPDDTGIWARSITRDLEFGAVAVQAAGALWYGGDSQPGRTYWQAIDATAFGAAAAQAMKWTFGRERPSQSSDPGLWFKGTRYQSFPSGEVTLQAGFVTPFIVNFAAQSPWLWALELLPAYDAAARVRQGGHWQSDVVAGWALGSAFGWLATRRDSPFFFSLSPRAIQVGIRAKF